MADWTLFYPDELGRIIRFELGFSWQGNYADCAHFFWVNFGTPDFGARFIFIFMEVE